MANAKPSRPGKKAEPADDTAAFDAAVEAAVAKAVAAQAAAPVTVVAAPKVRPVVFQKQSEEIVAGPNGTALKRTTYSDGMVAETGVSPDLLK